LLKTKSACSSAWIALSGKVLWKSVVLKAPLESIHRLNSRSSSTPATDGERIYTAFLDNSETPADTQSQRGP